MSGRFGEEDSEFRTSGHADPNMRTGSELPPHEIANAAEHLLAVKGACPRRDLQRALSRLFGFKALGGSLAGFLDEGIQYLIDDDRAHVDADERVAPTG